ncbi:Fic/DOC family protein [Nitzschia inconspicua]|uniref:Fic/DOC family protein n=1 Tax=Nitzschia inconspicua TaxID=303405 RepID=A0A9K3PFY3_9STRA|nr:Fic/DOC family protein [Nitzschia inconspicua]
MSNERLVGPLPAPPPSEHRQRDAKAENQTGIHPILSSPTGRQQQQQHLSHPYQNLVTISSFMADYRARKTIALGNHKRRGSDSRILGLDDHDATEQLSSHDYYSAAVHVFAQTQMSRQKAGLGHNANVENADGLQQLVQSHSAALNAAILHAENERPVGMPFFMPSAEDMCSWHSFLCPDHPQTGQYRKSPCRLGRTEFTHPDDLESEMNAFSKAMEQLHSKWTNLIHVGSTDPQNEEILIVSTYYCVALAAIMLYGILDIHCFKDGNGRIARICTNWVLRKVLGLPFTIVITANPSQRSEYTANVKSALQWIISLKEVDPTNPDFPLSVTHGTMHPTPHIEYGIFQDLIYMLLDRIAHACHECQRVIAEKSQAATANEEARIAREVRERAATGQCCICLEENPNILTICCGQATHLNCLAEWLGTASNCVACRKPLPTLSVRQQQSTEQRSAALIIPQSPVPINAHSNPRNDVWNRVLTNMLWEAAESADDAYCDNHECSNRAAVDCPNFMCRVCCLSYGDEECERHGDLPQLQHQGSLPTAVSMDDQTVSPVEEAEMDEPVSPRSQGLSGCRRCTNRAAIDCENQMCGRHCVMNGWHSCTRHNTFR